MIRALVLAAFGAMLIGAASAARSTVPAAGSPASAAGADDVQALLSKYIAWRGGSKFEEMRSIHLKGAMQVGAVNGQVQQWLVRDGRMRRDRVLGPVSDSEAVTPTSSWASNMSGQIEDMGDGGEGDRHDIALAFADVGHRLAGATYALLGQEQREHRTWRVVRLSFGGKDTYDLFLDSESGELLGTRTTVDRDTRFVRYSQWRLISGVRIPFEQLVTSANPDANESVRLESVEINAAVAPGLFERPASRPTWRFAGGAHSSGWIDFEFFNEEQIFIPAIVNGRPVHVLLDSGAGITVVDSALAKSLDAKLGGAVPVNGIGGQSTMQLLPDVDIRIGSLTSHRLTAGVIDLAALAGQLGHPMPFILGKEIFSQLLVDIDFPHRKIAFHEPGASAAPAGAVSVSLGRHGDNRTVPVVVEGHAPAPFDFDLGNNSALIVYSAFRDSWHLLDGRRQSLGLTGGVGGLIKPKCATLDSITLGGMRIANVPADFPDTAPGAVNSDRTAGNIGLPVFSRFRLITDYPHDRLWLAADPRAQREPFRKNRSGLIALPVGDRLKVLMVAPGSPAERAGWKEGAQIVAIDGHKIDADYGKSTLSRWGAQAPGTRVVLSLADGSTRELTLADYY